MSVLMGVRCVCSEDMCFGIVYRMGHVFLFARYSMFLRRKSSNAFVTLWNYEIVGTLFYIMSKKICEVMLIYYCPVFMFCLVLFLLRILCFYLRLKHWIRLLIHKSRENLTLAFKYLPVILKINDQ